MKVTILCISDSDKHFSSAIQEYMKRLWSTVDSVQIKPVKHGTREQIIAKETEQIQLKVQKYKQKDYQVILLSKWWTSLTTKDFCKKITQQPVVFVIWWPYGLDEEKMLSLVDTTISFGNQTMPHGLAKLVVLEQVYRSWMINQWRTYHY